MSIFRRSPYSYRKYCWVLSLSSKIDLSLPNCQGLFSINYVIKKCYHFISLKLSKSSCPCLNRQGLFPINDVIENCHHFISINLPKLDLSLPKLAMLISDKWYYRKLPLFYQLKIIKNRSVIAWIDKFYFR